MLLPIAPEPIGVTKNPLEDRRQKSHKRIPINITTDVQRISKEITPPLYRHGHKRNIPNRKS